MIGGAIVGNVGGFLIGNAVTCKPATPPVGTLDLTCDQNPIDYRLPLTLLGTLGGTIIGWRWR